MRSIQDQCILKFGTRNNFVRLIRRVRRMSTETQLSASEGKVADIGGINILKRGRLQHLFTLNDLHFL